VNYIVRSVGHATEIISRKIGDIGGTPMKSKKKQGLLL
jgi:hypothetical protein